MTSILNRITQFILIVSVPILLVVGMVRLTMSNAFLHFEYNRPNFPADPYGFTTEERLEYAPPAIEYLLNNEGISFLSDLRLPKDRVPADICIPAPENTDLCYMFNERERIHMQDVKIVTKATYNIGLLSAGLTILSALYLWRYSKVHLRAALFGGSVLTLGMIGVIIVSALTMWEIFFTGFHQIFFEGDSWLFRYSDTLIRLFPEQFWLDAALLIGGGSILGAVIILIIVSIKKPQSVVVGTVDE